MDERERFEAWAIRTHGKLTLSDPDAGAMWSAWKARASLGVQVEPQPVAGHGNLVTCVPHGVWDCPKCASPAQEPIPDSVHLTEHAGCAATGRDAARYRWLRDADQSDAALPYSELLRFAGKSLDAAIDAAMQASTPAQGDGALSDDICDAYRVPRGSTRSDVTDDGGVPAFPNDQQEQPK